MKSAEDWIELHGRSSMSEDEAKSYSELCEDDIREIQLDAWKQGMKDAAKHVENWHPFDKIDNFGLRDVIINEANSSTITSKDSPK